MDSYNFALIKPVSGSCCLHCRYCFYRDETVNRKVSSYGTMSEETLKRAVMYTAGNAVHGSTFLFQGGEPLLAGISFYQHYNELCQDIAALRPDFTISSCVQTSAYLLKKDMVRVLKEGHFLVGVSLDGPEKLHDLNRTTVNGRGSFKQVFSNTELLRAQAIPVNILCVVTKDNARAQELWRFFMDNGFDYLQFIKGLAPIGSDQELISSEHFADFFLEIFDLWFSEFTKGHYVSVRMIDDLFAALSGRGISSCDLRGQCSVQNVIEADGSIYPCDFYVLDEWKLGSVCDSPVTVSSSFARSFTKKLSLPRACLDCNALAVCKNGCRRYRGSNNLSAYCQTFRRLLSSKKEQITYVLKHCL